MFSFKMLLSVLALTLLVLSVESGSGSSSKGGGVSSSPDHLRGQALTDLFNSRVVEAEVVRRPIGSSSSGSSSGSSSRSSSGSSGFWTSLLPPELDASSHSGVRVKLDDDSEWLVHKGSGYGRSSQTVVTDAGHMSPAWETDRRINVERDTTISDLVDTGGANYNPLCSNCHHATRDMERRLG
ncbi:P17/29C-like protein DDB_G0287399 [Lates japonicus]